MPSKTLVINCGASHVAAAVFSFTNGKLTLEDLDTRDLRYDVTKEEAWLPALAEGLRDLSRSNSKFRGKATFILPGYQLLIKPIKVPHVDAAKRTQIIAFEAQNNIPFPLAETVWGIIYDRGTNLIDVYINYLRNKIDSGFPDKMIHTVRGIGYMLDTPEKAVETPVEQVT